VREHLVEMRRRFGTTILLTTHDLKDISATCERLLVLDRGKLLYDGSREGFQARFADERTLSVELDAAPSADEKRTLEAELAADGVRAEWDGERRLRVHCPRAAKAPKVTAAVLRSLDVRDLTLQGVELDTIVARLYRNGAKETS
jgi:ABC-2 type transport system ATP-binding protein